MTPRTLTASRALLRAGFTARGFQTSSRLSNQVAAALPASKPVGAFRSGILGFFAGTTLAGFGAYNYVRQEFKTANDLLLEDLYALQASVQRVSAYVQTLEEKVGKLEKTCSK